MHLWVDADACPAVIKDILFRAAERKAIAMTLVANRLLRVPASRFIRALQVPGGYDVADQLDRLLARLPACRGASGLAAEPGFPGLAQVADRGENDRVA